MSIPCSRILHKQIANSTHVTELSAYFQIAFAGPQPAASEIRAQKLNIFLLVKKPAIDPLPTQMNWIQKFKPTLHKLHCILVTKTNRYMVIAHYTKGNGKEMKRRWKISTKRCFLNCFLKRRSTKVGEENSLIIIIKLENKHTDRCDNTRGRKYRARGSGKEIKYNSLCIEI
jgi:hypothetical protein